jgi:class 3 adenylate cyclase
MRDNGSPAPKYQRITVVDRNNIYGDGVNVAARLERLCAAREAYFAAVAHDQVEGKVAC